MGQKNYTVEQKIVKLREIELFCGQSKGVALGVSTEWRLCDCSYKAAQIFSCDGVGLRRFFAHINFSYNIHIILSQF